MGCAGCLDQSRAVERRNGARDDGRGPVVACAPARGAGERWTLGRGRPRGLGRARPDARSLAGPARLAWLLGSATLGRARDAGRDEGPACLLTFPMAFVKLYLFLKNKTLSI